MRYAFSTLALLATSLLVNDVSARFDVRKRDIVVVTDNVVVTDEVVVTQEEDGSYVTGDAVAIKTATIAGTPVLQSSSSTSISVAPTTSSTVAPPPASTSVSSLSSGAIFFQKSSTHSHTPAPTTAPKPASTPTSVAPPPPPPPQTTLATVASPAPVPSVTPPAPAPVSGNKRGLAFNDASILSNFVSGSSKVAWAYNWGQTVSNLPSGLEYVPMLWGLRSDDTSNWSKHATSAIASGSSHLLSFNEPDLGAQSNIAFTDAAAGYKTYMQPFAGKAKLGSPAVTNGGSPMGLTWLSNFLNSCSGCQIDFVPIHWYAGANNVDYFKSYIQQAYAAGGNRPIWITEFQASGSADEQNVFLQQVLPWLDAQNYVERYAYFMASEGNLLSQGSTLSTLGNTFATFT